MIWLSLFLFWILTLQTSLLSQNILSRKPQQSIKLKNNQVIKLHASKFNMNKLKSVTFSPFRLSDFNIKQREIVNLKNGKSLSAEKFLEEVNNVEKKLNEWGYSLRDKNEEIILGELSFPYRLLSQQNKLLEPSSNKFMLENTKITPCGILTEETIQSALKSGTPKEPWPIKYDKDWSLNFGDRNFGVDISYKFNFNAEEVSSNIFPSGMTTAEIIVAIFNERIRVMKLIDKLYAQPAQSQITLTVLENKAVDDYLKTSSKKTYSKNLDWETEIEFSFGPFDLSGTFGISGYTGLFKNFNIDKQKLSEELIPFVNLDCYGRLDVGIEIAEAGIMGRLKLIEDTLKYFRTLELKNPSKDGYFVYNSNANNYLKALSGEIYAFIKIDYLIGSKKYLIKFYDGSGINTSQNLFSSRLIQPTQKDRNLWLEITRISGITNFTARNEKNGCVPKSFEINVEAAGHTFIESIKDWNNDGVIETPLKFKIPLLSALKIPITISVKENYEIEDLQFKTVLDLVKGEPKDLSFCYDPNSKEISGSIIGKEEEELISTGDTNYFGERNHSIRFKLVSNLSFKEASPKVK